MNAIEIVCFRIKQIGEFEPFTWNKRIDELFYYVLLPRILNLFNFSRLEIAPHKEHQKQIILNE